MANERQSTGRQSEGQALIQVALAMVVLLALVGLAVDAGMAYAERRHMQNAADAAALAGAYELCFGDPAMAETTARQYATERNRATGADVSIVGGWRVEVEASTVADTFLSGVLGINNVPVAAQAAAACSGVQNLCGVWPITFSLPRWEDITCNAKFYVWNDNKLEEDAPFCTVTLPDGSKKALTMCEACDCENPEGAPDGAAYIIGPGARGWVNFPPAEPPYTDPCVNNCSNSAQQLVCIIDGGGYGGLLDINDLCLPSKQGVAANVLKAVERNLNQEVNLLLWDGECDKDDLPDNTCVGQNLYRILGTGCFTPLRVLDGPDALRIMIKDEYAVECKSKTSAGVCSKAAVIEGRKSCECGSTCGSTVGTGPPQPGQVRGVSLINP